MSSSIRGRLQLRVGIGVVAGVLGSIMVACSPAPGTPPAVIVQPTDQAIRLAQIAADAHLQAGQTVYNLRCAHCHGVNGEGQLAATVADTEQLGLHTVPPHNATGQTWQHPDQLLRQVVLQGIANPLDHYPMPAFAEVMTDEDIEQVLAYIRLWWTDEQRTWQAQVTARRAEIEAEFRLPNGE